MMRKILNELEVFYSSRAVRFAYLVVPVYVFALEYLLGFGAKELFVAPGIVVQGAFGGLFGPVTVLLTGKIWDQDFRRGTIKNIYPMGVNRTKYFGYKFIMLVIHSIAFSLDFSVFGLCMGVLKGANGKEYSLKSIIETNVCSLLTVFLISLCYSLLATVFFVFIKNYRFALICAALLSFGECILHLVVLFDIEPILVPYGFLIKTLVAVESSNIDLFINLFFQGSIVMIVYIVACTFFSFVFLLRREH